MIRKLRVRFVLFTMLLVTILLVTMLVMVFRFNKLAIQAQSIAALKRAATMPLGRWDPGDDLPEELPVAWFTLTIGPDGELHSWGSGQFDLTDRETLGALMDEARQKEQSVGVLEEQGLRYYRSGKAVAFADMSGERLILANIRRSCIAVGAASFVIFFLVCVSLSYVTVHPVAKAWNQQRQFVADASHELKTPLSVIMANAELLQSGDCGENREKYSGNILAMSYQMRSLVERMLEMARVDNLKPEQRILDFSELTSDAALSVQLLYEEQGRPLSVDVQEGLHIRGSESHLYQLLDVLLDNALKYSEGEGPVELSLKSQGRACLLTVTSPGTPLTRQQQRDVFKRFYRADPARARNGSYGLGLSIAQQIVHIHRGSIWAQGKDYGNTFFVLLPLRARHQEKVTSETGC